MCERDIAPTALAKTFGVASMDPSSATMISASIPRALKYSAHAARPPRSRRGSLHVGRARRGRVRLVVSGEDQEIDCCLAARRAAPRTEASASAATWAATEAAAV